MESLSAYIKSSLIEENVEKQLTDVLKGYKGLSVVPEYEYPLSGLCADFMLMQNNKPFVAIEVKTNLEDNGTKEVGRRQLERGRNFLNLRFGILTDAKKYILYDWWHAEEEEFTYSDLGDLISFLINKRYISADASLYKEYLTNLFSREFPSLTISKGDIDFDKEKNTIRLGEDDELKLFNILFPSVSTRSVCRYTTLSSLFAILENESYRMFATEGMNDIEDGMYLWNKLYNEKQKDAYLAPHRKSVYIMSCSPMKKRDDLTMWRLYGNDAKGMCLTFKVRKTANKEGFYFRKVRYDHDIIEKLRVLTKYNSTDEHKNYPTFIFNYWELWGAFVKSAEYKIEEEIRLAYIPSPKSRKIDNDKQWMLLQPNSIVCNYADFKESIAPFPLNMTQILLGASCPEKNVNKLQLKKMIEASEEFKGKNIEVEISDVDNYRPSK